MREFLFVFKTNKNGFYFSSNFITVFTLDGCLEEILFRAANSVKSRKKGFLFKDLLYREIKLEAFKTSRPFFSLDLYRYYEIIRIASESFELILRREEEIHRGISLLGNIGLYRYSIAAKGLLAFAILTRSLVAFDRTR